MRLRKPEERNVDLLDPVVAAIFAGIVPAACDAEAGEPWVQPSVVVEQVKRKLLQVPTGSVKRILRLIAHDVATVQNHSQEKCK
jgi:hypothetical protein